MPVVTVELFEGRTVEQKKKLAEGITRIVSEHADCPESAVIVMFRDLPKHNWAMGGELASNK